MTFAKCLSSGRRVRQAILDYPRKVVEDGFSIRVKGIADE
jgi:hypothetical protein